MRPMRPRVVSVDHSGWLPAEEVASAILAPDSSDET